MTRASKYKDQKAAVLRVIFRKQMAHGRSPSVRDLADQFEVGVATMHSYLTKLHHEGMIEWKPGRHRTLKVTQNGLKVIHSP